jgi:hypothetical protein
VTAAPPEVLPVEQTLLTLAAVGGVALVAWLVAKPPALFVVRVRDGNPRATRGKVTDAFLAAVADLLREYGVQSGEIHGVARGRRIALWFSRELPAAFCQRLRNWWAVSGWSADPGRAGV